MTKQIIGRGHESRGLYILDPKVPRPIACSGITTPLETHCRLGHLSQPPGFVAQGEIGKVCRLRKSLYGLKQSLRAWFGKLSQAVEKFGFQKSKSNNFVFYRNSSSGIILLVVYVDDIVITGSDSSRISSLKVLSSRPVSYKGPRNT